MLPLFRFKHYIFERGLLYQFTIVFVIEIYPRLWQSTKFSDIKGCFLHKLDLFNTGETQIKQHIQALFQKSKGSLEEKEAGNTAPKTNYIWVEQLQLVLQNNPTTKPENIYNMFIAQVAPLQIKVPRKEVVKAKIGAMRAKRKRKLTLSIV